MTNTITELHLTTSPEVRAQFMDRLEVLDMVGTLLELPNGIGATASKVAEFYQVPEETMKSVLKRHVRELESDGMRTYKRAELVADLAEHNIVVPNRGWKVLPKRAVLRVGMLLTNSPIATEVRSQLLNMTEVVAIPDITNAIEKEKGILLSIGQAISNGDVNALAKANAQLVSFKNRHIQEVQNELDFKAKELNFLVEEALTFEQFYKVFRALIYVVCREKRVVTGDVYSSFYRFLREGHGISLKTRQTIAINRANAARAAKGQAPHTERYVGRKFALVNMIKETEYNQILRIMKAWAIDMGISEQAIEEANRLTEVA